MRQAYALLGLCFLIVGLGAYLVAREAATHPAVPIPHEKEVSAVLTQSQPSMNTLSLTSTALKEGGSLPSRYSCDGEGISPAFTIEGAPEGTRSFALIGIDPDIPQAAKSAIGADEFVHLVAYDIPPDTRTIEEGDMPGKFGLNSSNKTAYAPLCPPPQFEPKQHRYVFTLYALDRRLSFPTPPPQSELLQAIEGAVLASSTLTGRYQRK